MSQEIAGTRTQASRLLAWMNAWDLGVRGLLAERPDPTPGASRPFTPAGIVLAAVMLAACVAVVARVGPHPFLLVMFLAFATLYFALVPARLLLRPLGAGARGDESADLREAAARSREAWAETASRAVAAWHLAREAALRQLDPLVLSDSEARAAAERIRSLVPPAAPIPGTEVGALRAAASTPLTPLPALEGWGAVAGDVVFLARRKPFTIGEVVVVVVGVLAIPPAVFLAIDGAAAVVACAVVPEGPCANPEAGRNLFLLGMISLTGVVMLWRAVTRTRVECPACRTLVGIPRLAPHGRCQGCSRRVWVQWRR
ncbi:MAG TPA: hypothetical protein VIW03_15255 [Anaeromyxobacter sp.]